MSAFSSVTLHAIVEVNVKLWSDINELSVTYATILKLYVPTSSDLVE